MLKIAFTAIMVRQIIPNAIIRKGVTIIPELPKIIADATTSITIETIASANR